MSAAAVLPSSLSKEIRALALPWLACLACMLVPAVADAPRWIGGLSVPAYFLGVVALGALSIGHEYTDRTLSLLLTLPARRGQLFAIKLGALAVMLLPLWFAAHTLVLGDSRLPQESRDMAALLPLLCGLFLAPWFTMACRNPIGGAVFAIAIPGVLLVAGELIGVRIYGHGSVMEAFRLTFASFGTIGLCATGAVMGWWTFIRLEAIEGPGQDVRLPQWLRLSNATSTAAPQFTRRHPLLLLFKKEIRLQQLPLVLAALYALGWLAAEWLTTFVSDLEYQDVFAALTLPYALFLPMLIGSSASAGERQMGTLEWQVLLPIAVWKQWAVKVGVVLGLAMVLALGLPMMLLYLGGVVRAATQMSVLVGRNAIAIVILIAAGSLYVSSLCRSGLRALVMSIPVTLAATLFLQLALERVGSVSYRAAARLASAGAGRFAQPRDMDPDLVIQLVIAGFVALVLRFALTNHRSADRTAARVWTQVILTAAFVTIAVITGAAAQAFLR
jgi:ABC-type transport system involved in multi-copper enzyme maturation permease subunit